MRKALVGNASEPVVSSWERSIQLSAREHALPVLGIVETLQARLSADRHIKL
jgi:hypothetical protein